MVPLGKTGKSIQKISALFLTKAHESILILGILWRSNGCYDHTPNAVDPGPLLGQGTGSYKLQLRACTPQLKIPHTTTKIEDPECHSPDATKTQRARINKNKYSSSSQF